jgi:iron(III) transport system ATP-binding protein
MVTVKLEGITKYFGEVVAAQNVSFHVEEGELFFLLGPSGCGKTTTLRIIAGFYKPDKGHLYFDEKMMLEIPAHRRNTGMVFQNYALWPHMTVYDNITYGLKIRGLPMQDRVSKAKDVLKIVKMEEYGMRYPNQLSGGQQQRVALARALVLEPDVLLLDEPLSNLDAKLRLETRYEIKRIQKNLEITSIYVTHDQEEALTMADRVAIMNKGSIEQIGSPREIYTEPNNQFVAEFVGETNPITGEIVEKNHDLIIRTDYDFQIIAKKYVETFEVGQKVMCLIRPQHIELFKSLPKRQNVIKARILGLSFYGVAENYRLSTSEGLEIKATVSNPTKHDKKEGDAVYISFRPENVKVFSL